MKSHFIKVEGEFYSQVKTATKEIELKDIIAMTDVEIIKEAKELSLSFESIPKNKRMAICGAVFLALKIQEDIYELLTN